MFFRRSDMFGRKTRYGGCAFALSFFAVAASAQTEEELFSYTLEELLQVTVTAQKREQNAQDVPLSVASLRGETLEVLNSSGMDVRQLSGRVPSLRLESSFGRSFPRFYLRGMGNTDFDLLASQPVSVLMDDVVQESPALKAFPLFDLDRVEVLRGPQGTLFGRNTPAGIVKLESRKPRSRWQADGRFGYGSFGSSQFEGVINLPLNEDMALRYSMLDQQRQDWIDNRAPGYSQDDQLGAYHDQAGRLQWRYQRDKVWDVLFNYHYRNARGDSQIFRANIVEPGSNRFVDDFEMDTVYQDAGQHNRQSTDLSGSSLRIDYDFGRHSLHYIGGYESAALLSRGDVDGGYGACYLVQRTDGKPSCDRTLYQPYERGTQMGPGFIAFIAETAAEIPEHRQLTHEWRLASNELGTLDYQLGLFRFDETLDVIHTSYDSAQDGVESGRARQHMDTASWAMFGSLDYQFDERWASVTGLRYSHDERDWHGNRQNQNGQSTSPRIDVVVQDGQWSWDESISYRWDAARMSYARIAKGYRAPSIQGRNLLFNVAPTSAEAETLLSYELGLKSEWWQRRMRLNAALFYYIARGQQLTAVGGGSDSARLLNAKKTTGNGFEIETEFALTPKFQLNAGISYNRTELQDEGLAVTPCNSACTVLDPLDSHGRAIIDGNELPQSPRWIASLGSRYGIDWGNGELFVLGDIAYRSEVNFFLYESREYTGAALTEIGLRLGYVWSRAGQRYEWALFGRNLGNEVQAEGGIDFNNRTVYLNEPRYYGAEFKLTFR